VAVRTPSNAKSGARDELRLEPGLVEPRRPDLTRVVADASGEDLQPAASPAGHRADDDLDDRFLVPEEVADLLRRRRLLVAPRALPEHVLDRHEPELREAPRDRRPYALQRFDRGTAPVRARRGPWARPALGLVDPGKR